MILSFELSMTVIKSIEVEADSLEEAKDIIAAQFSENPVVPVSLRDDVDDLSLMPIDFVPDKKGLYIEDDFDTETEFYEFNWTDHVYDTLDETVFNIKEK